jgi:hypothetical protein
LLYAYSIVANGLIAAGALAGGLFAAVGTIFGEPFESPINGAIGATWPKNERNDAMRASSDQRPTNNYNQLLNEFDSRPHD